MKPLHFSSKASAVIRSWLNRLEDACTPIALKRYILAQQLRVYRRFAYYYGRLQQLSRHHRRKLQQVCGVTVTAAAFLLALGQSLPVQANTITVDGTTCQLADAITAANTDTATNGCTAGTGDDIIDLQSDVMLTSTLPYITSTITLNGNNHEIDGANSYRVLQIGDSDLHTRNAQAITPNVTINNLHIVNGFQEDGPLSSNGAGINIRNAQLTLVNSTLSGNSAEGNGGAIAFSYSQGNIISTTIENNTAYNGGGVFASYSDVVIASSTISGNIANEHGAGLSNEYGSIDVSQSTISHNNAAGKGGGAHIYYGSITTNNTIISQNKASAGAGISLYGQESGDIKEIHQSTISGNESSTVGGGVSIQYTDALIANSTINENSAPYSGGGLDIYSFSGDGLSDYTITITRSAVTNNETGFGGAGISSYYATLQIAESTISGNQAINSESEGFGGGIQLYGSVLSMTNSTVSNNLSDGSGGGIYFYGRDNHSITIEQSTLSGNQAGVVGGAIAAGRYYGAAIEIKQSTITLNHVDENEAVNGGGLFLREVELLLENSIVSGNSAGSEPSEIYSYTNLYNPPTTTGNLIGTSGNADVDGFTLDATDLIPEGDISTILETTLADNGGETLTHLLVQNSPATDQLPAESAMTDTDQRGVRRVIGKGLDIGAVEMLAKQFLPMLIRP